MEVFMILLLASNLIFLVEVIFSLVIIGRLRIELRKCRQRLRKERVCDTHIDAIQRVDIEDYQ